MSRDQHQPPKWAIQFLEWFCPVYLYEGILGDLLEQFEEDQLRYSLFRTKLRFLVNVFRLFHPVLLKEKKFFPDIIIIRMLSNYFKVSFRGMKKTPFYNTTNILGLAFALAFVFIIFLYLQQTWAQDSFHENKDHIFRLYTKVFDKANGSLKNESAVTSVPLAEVIANELADIEAYTRVASATKSISINADSFEERIHFVDNDFLKIFSFPVLEGHGSKIEGNNVFISKEKAFKLFGYKNPIGETFKIHISGEEIFLTIVGIVDNKKALSSIKFDFLTSMDVFKKEIGEDTYNSMNYGFLENYVLYKGGKAREMEENMTSVIAKFSQDEKREVQLGLQALPTLHFENKIIGNAHYTDPQKLYLLGSLALVVLVISVLNFITLSSSNSLGRIKEMGVRGALGAFKGDIKRQLLVESCIVTGMASVLGIALAFLLIHNIALLIGTPLTFNLDFSAIVFIGCMLLILAFINGTIQYKTVKRFNIKQALLSKVNNTVSSQALSKYLLVAEFVFALILIASAICINMQMRFIQEKELGYLEERLLQITINSTEEDQKVRQWFEAFKIKAEQHRNIETVSASMNNFQEPWTQLLFEQPQGKPEGIFYNQVSPTYIKTIGAELAIGKDFSMNPALNSKSIIVNEALVKHYGWDDPLAQQIPGKNFAEGHEIIGVIKDFHFSSMHERIEPLILATNLDAIGEGITGLNTYVWPAKYYQLNVRLGTDEIMPTIAYLENLWNDYSEGTPFIFHFADDLLDKKYEQEKRWADIMEWASAFSITISFIGLLGLLQLTLKRRTKEIGVRKILGASPSNIIRLLTGEYLSLILLSNMIALPLAWFIMQEWLASFSYKIALTPVFLLLASATVLVIAIAVMFFQVIKALKTNAVQTLKIE